MQAGHVLNPVRLCYGSDERNMIRVIVKVVHDPRDEYRRGEGHGGPGWHEGWFQSAFAREPCTKDLNPESWTG